MVRQSICGAATPRPPATGRCPGPAPRCTRELQNTARFCAGHKRPHGCQCATYICTGKGVKRGSPTPGSVEPGLTAGEWPASSKAASASAAAARHHRLSSSGVGFSQEHWAQMPERLGTGGIKGFMKKTFHSLMCSCQISAALTTCQEPGINGRQHSCPRGAK